MDALLARRSKSENYPEKPTPTISSVLIACPSPSSICHKMDLLFNSIRVTDVSDRAERGIQEKR
jgi:hypothetical protein